MGGADLRCQLSVAANLTAQHTEGQAILEAHGRLLTASRESLPGVMCVTLCVTVSTFPASKSQPP